MSLHVYASTCVLRNKMTIRAVRLDYSEEDIRDFMFHVIISICLHDDSIYVCAPTTQNVIRVCGHACG